MHTKYIYKYKENNSLNDTTICCLKLKYVNLLVYIIAPRISLPIEDKGQFTVFNALGAKREIEQVAGQFGSRLSTDLEISKQVGPCGKKNRSKITTPEAVQSRLERQQRNLPLFPLT
jgi:hypothetical protein